MRSWRLLLLLGLLAASSAPARGQSILRMPGRTIEVVGLKRWTISMIQDSLAKYAPGDSLHHHACAATLRYTLGFADAAATSYTGMNVPGDITEYVVVSVVEPQDSARVHYRRLPLDTLAPRAEWQDAIALVRSRPGTIQASLIDYTAAAKQGFAAPLPAYLQRDSAAVRQFWTFLFRHRSEADRQLALSVLASDSNFHNRVIAASILANFGAHDATWVALLEAMRESDGMVKGIAGTVLTAVARAEPRTVDWALGVPAIHAMLNGTSLFGLSATLEVLSASGIDPRWSQPFLANGGEMVLAYLSAELPTLRRAAHHFLTTVSGQDYGYDVRKWQNWIAAL